MVQWLYARDEGLDYYGAFFVSCANGQLEVAQWLFQQENIDYHVWDDHTFVQACRYGHLEVAKWLASLSQIECSEHVGSNERLGGIDLEDPFIETCGTDKFEILQWLWSLATSEGIPIDLHANDNLAFYKACVGGQMKVAKWLLTLHETDGGLGEFYVRGRDRDLLCGVCQAGHLEIAKWLIILGVTLEDRTFIQHIEQTEMAEWLSTLK